MNFDSRIVRLDEVVNFRTGRLDSNAAEENGQYPFFTCSPTTLSINDFAFDDEAVLLAGNNANGVFPVKYYRGKFNAYQRTYVITPLDKSKVDVRWLYFQIKKVTSDLQKLSVGSATKFLTKKILDAYEINLPNIGTQRTVAKILWDIEKKIPLNRQINQTLEAMAQALFKSWFVDFEPVKAKLSALAAGGSTDDANLAAMSAISGKTTEQLLTLKTANPDQFQQLYTTADLFPSEMVNSELGEIPKGWEVRLSGDLIDVRDGTHDSPQVATSGFPLVTSKHIVSGELDLSSTYLISEEDYFKINKRSKVSKGDILLTMIGTYGIPYLVNQKNVNFAIKNIGLFRTSEKTELKNFFYLYLRTREMQDYLYSRVAGTTQKYLSLKVLRSIELIVPDVNVLDLFNDHINHIHEKIYKNQQENFLLSETRDTLLPKLLSGELLVDGVSE